MEWTAIVTPHQTCEHSSTNQGDGKMRETNADLSDRPRFSVVISEDGRRIGALWESEAIRARSNFGAGGALQAIDDHSPRRII